MTWAPTEALVKVDNIFPMAIKAQAYLANFLLNVSIKREKVSGSDWKLSLHADLAGPSICNFSIDGELNYKNGNDANMDLKSEDLVNATAKITFNSDEITVNINDFG